MEIKHIKLEAEPDVVYDIANIDKIKLDTLYDLVYNEQTGLLKKIAELEEKINKISYDSDTKPDYPDYDY